MKSLKLFCGADQLLILTSMLDSSGISHKLVETYHGYCPTAAAHLLIEENDYERARDLLNELLGEGNWSS